MKYLEELYNIKIEKIIVDPFEDKVKEWHNNKNKISLREYLGLSLLEYHLYVLGYKIKKEQ